MLVLLLLTGVRAHLEVIVVIVVAIAIAMIALDSIILPFLIGVLLCNNRTIVHMERGGDG